MVDVLFWRVISLQTVEDFLLILNNMGSSDAFIDFEIMMWNFAQVNSPTLLHSKMGERNLVNRLMGLPKIELVSQPAQT